MHTKHHSLFKEVLAENVVNYQYNIIEFGISEGYDERKRPEYIYKLKTFNGAFKNETKSFEFRYFRYLDKDEIQKFVFRSLSEQDSNFEFKNGKFNKRFICY